MPSLSGKTEGDEDAVIYETDLAMDQTVSAAFFQQLKRRREPLKGTFVESTMRGKRYRLSAVKLTKEAMDHGDLYRCRIES